MTGPAGNTPGIYTATAAAADESGDEISYTFTADNGTGTKVTFGPRTSANAATPNVIDLGLTEGTWTITVTVDEAPNSASVRNTRARSGTPQIVEAMPPAPSGASGLFSKSQKF